MGSENSEGSGSSNTGSAPLPEMPAEYEGAMAQWKQSTIDLRTRYGREFQGWSQIHPTNGLTTEIAFRRGQGKTRIVLASGANGVDGYLGMYLQLYAMGHLVQKYPDCDFMFIGPINPYGMKEYQRTNEHNAEISRNYMHEEFNPVLNERYIMVHNERYNRCRYLLYPDQGTPIERQRFRISVAFKDLATEWGRKFLQPAIYDGQSRDEDGLFYTGKQRQEESRAFKRFLQDYLLVGGRSSLPIDAVLIDVHGSFDTFGRIAYSTAFSRTDERFHRLASAVPGVVPREESFHDVPGDLATYIADLRPLQTSHFTYLRMSCGTIPLRLEDGRSASNTDEPFTGFTGQVPVMSRDIHPDIPEVYKSSVHDMKRGMAREPETRDALHRWAATALAVRSMVSCNMVHRHGASREEEEVYRQEFRTLFNPKDKAWMISPLEKVISGLVASAA